MYANIFFTGFPHALCSSWKYPSNEVIWCFWTDARVRFGLVGPGSGLSLSKCFGPLAPGGIRWHYPLNFFSNTKFIKTHSKNKNIYPLKIYFAPLSNLKTCLRVCWRLLSFVTQRSKTKITIFRCYARKQPRRCNCFITLSALRKSTARMVKWNLHKSDQCPIDLNSLQLAPRIYSANIG